MDTLQDWRKDLSDDKRNQHTVSIRLHTTKVLKYEDVLKETYKKDGRQPAKRTKIVHKYGCGVAFSLTRQSSQPVWADDFKSLTNISIPNNEYSKAVIVFKIKIKGMSARFMSISLGYGDSLLDKTKTESDFGRNIAAQKISEADVSSTGTIQIADAIVQIEKQYTSSKSKGMEQLVSSASEFPNRISGIVHNGVIETKIDGQGALLKAKRHMALDEIVSDLEFYLKTYIRPTSMADWATRLTRINEKNLRERLDDKVFSKMLRGQVEYGVAWPDYKSVEELSTDLLKDMPSLPPVEQVKWYMQLKIKEYDNYSAKQFKAKIKRSKLIATDSEGHSDKVALYSGFFVDFVDKRQHYLLFSGNWYSVSQDFYDTLKKKIGTVDEYTDELPILETELNDDGKVHYEGEGAYNEKLAKFVKNGRLFDKNNFSNNRGNSFPGVEEPADVITSSRRLFFVKKGDSSSALSHLFLQGLVSAKLLTKEGDSDFRQFINNNSGFEEDIFSEDLMNSDVTLVFVIIKKDKQLPFFSMISFSEVVDNLREMGYKIQIAWARMSTLPKKTEKVAQ